MRKTNAIKNMFGSFASYIIAAIFQFITQRFLIQTLGIEYSGVNGLFANILTMLSIAELGIGTSIIYKLYDPIAKGDKETIKSWLQFYKKCYRYVAIAVLVLGIIIIPFVPIIVGNTSINDNITLLYLISLTEVVFSYLLTYKRSILYADQKNYVINIIHIVYTIVLNIIQIATLLTTRNYILFLFEKIIFRLIENVAINLYVNHRYPYLTDSAKNISKSDEKDILSRIKAIFLQKISFVINKGIDSTIISVFINIAAVGYYTNYNLVVNAITAIIYQIMSGMTASVGNLLTENNKQKNYLTYKRINFVNSMLSSFGTTMFLCLMNPFIEIWLGDHYQLSISVLISFSIFIYADSIRRSITMFKEAAGICKEDKYAYIAMAAINLTTSITLCKLIGISGVILGTAISYLFLLVYSYPKYVFPTVFNQHRIKYYKENGKYLFTTVILGVILLLISFEIQTVVTNKYLSFLYIGLVSILLFIISNLLIYKNCDEYQYYKKLIRNTINKKIKKFSIK